MCKIKILTLLLLLPKVCLEAYEAMDSPSPSPGTTPPPGHTLADSTPFKLQRTAEEVVASASAAGLTGSVGSVQLLHFSQHLHSEEMRLMEVHGPVLEALRNGDKYIATKIFWEALPSPPPNCRKGGSLRGFLPPPPRSHYCYILQRMLPISIPSSTNCLIFRLVIRGSPSDEAVLCTQDKTFEIRVADTSNTLLIAPSLTLPTTTQSGGQCKPDLCTVYFWYDSYSLNSAGSGSGEETSLRSCEVCIH